MISAQATDRIDELYDTWFEDDGARHCGELPSEACRSVPGNFFLFVTSLVLTKLGDALANPKTTLTWLMGSVGAPAGLIALLVPLRESGSMLPQIFIGGWVRRLRIRKWVWVAGSVLQAVAIAGIGLAAGWSSGTTAGVAILVGVMLFSLARSLSSVASKDVQGKILPKGRRGRASGLASSISGILTLVIALGWLALRRDEVPPQVYGYGLAAAAGLWLLAATVFSRIAESPGETADSAGLAEAIDRLSLLRTDEHFQRFVITRALFVSTALAGPYYVMIAQEQSRGLSVLALFVLAGGLASSLSSMVWGKLADRSSRRVMLAGAGSAAVIGLATSAVSYLQPSWLDSPTLPIAAFFGLGIAHAGVRLGRKTFVVDLAKGNKRTDYVATGNTVIGLLMLTTTALGGLTAIIGPGGMLGVLAMAGFVGVWVGRGLPEVE